MRPSNDTICVCATLLLPDSDRKRQRQWSEQKVSACPPGQTFTPRLLIMVNLTPSLVTLLSASPRSFAEPLLQSRNTSTPTSSFCGSSLLVPTTAGGSPPLLYFLALRICGVWPNRPTTASANSFVPTFCLLTFSS